MSWVAPGVWSCNCFIGFFICFLSGHVIDFVVKSPQANPHSFNPEMGGGLVALKGLRSMSISNVSVRPNK